MRALIGNSASPAPPPSLCHSLNASPTRISFVFMCLQIRSFIMRYLRNAERLTHLFLTLAKIKTKISEAQAYRNPIKPSPPCRYGPGTCLTDSTGLWKQNSRTGTHAEASTCIPVSLSSTRLAAPSPCRPALVCCQARPVWCSTTTLRWPLTQSSY